VNRREVLEIFAKHRGEAPAITGPSFGGRVLYSTSHQPATIYNMELGYPTAMVLGLALSLPKERVFAVEGDGSMLAGIGVLTTIARYAPKNLVVLVVDNGAYVTTGSVPSATSTGTDLVAMAKGAGILEAHIARDAPTLDALMARAVSENGPFFLVARIEQETMASVGKSTAMPFDIVESSMRFRRVLEDKGLVPPIWAV
jgi:thiamine pyrophosphate-dependent acetolactate synthase large subunit-like protein